MYLYYSVRGTVLKEEKLLVLKACLFKVRCIFPCTSGNPTILRIFRQQTIQNCLASLYLFISLYIFVMLKQKVVIHFPLMIVPTCAAFHLFVFCSIHILYFKSSGPLGVQGSQPMLQMAEIASWGNTGMGEGEGERGHWIIPIASQAANTILTFERGVLNGMILSPLIGTPQGL